MKYLLNVKKFSLELGICDLIDYVRKELTFLQENNERSEITMNQEKG